VIGGLHPLPPASIRMTLVFASSVRLVARIKAASPLTVMAGHRAGHPWRHSAVTDPRDGPGGGHNA
jgi:hypothetical protein